MYQTELEYSLFNVSSDVRPWLANFLFGATQGCNPRVQPCTTQCDPSSGVTMGHIQSFVGHWVGPRQGNRLWQHFDQPHGQLLSNHIWQTPSTWLVMKSGGLYKGVLVLNRWFEVGCAIWAQVSQIGASQIKEPTGSIFQKYVYSSLMVKMRINLWSFQLFWFLLVWG